MAITISAAVEGPTDAAVVTKIIDHVGAHSGVVYGQQGKACLKQRIRAYNHAARHSPWLILVDLDHDADCAPPLRQAWLPQLSPHLCFRVAVRAVEAWLLADAQALSGFLGVPCGRIPTDPEALDDPKQVVVDLARRSRRRDIRIDMVPRESSGRPVGPAYTSRMIEFASKHWRPEVAANSADSLARAIRCLRRLVEAAG